MKIGDIYTIPKYSSLHIVGRVIAYTPNREVIIGAEMNQGINGLECREKVWRFISDLQMLIPATQGGTEASLNNSAVPHAREKSRVCSNSYSDCIPGCPEHKPLDWNEGLTTDKSNTAVYRNEKNIPFWQVEL